MDKIEKLLLKQALLTGLVHGVGWSLFAMVAMSNVIERFFFLMTSGIFIAIFLDFFLIYRVNLKIHMKFKKKYGQKYMDIVECELEKTGMKKMLKTRWFFDRDKLDKKGEFLRN